MAEKRAQRRLAAILAADVVGYSRLMEQDEAGTLAALKARRRDILAPVVAQHNGRIVKLMGDGVLVEFGSAVDAVQCAVELQKGFAEANQGVAEASRIVLRVGINLGDVIVEGSDLYGDGVNVAARLEALAEPGCILVSATVHDHVIGKLELSFDDLGERALKNIQKPVRIYRMLQKSDVPLTRPLLILPDKPSIAVLPFANMSGDPEQEYFADGMVEDIITALSRFNQLFVIARNSTFTYKGKAVDIKQVGRDLGVRYVLEGSVRKAQARVRVTGQLIDATTGVHLWADRFDGEIADIFDMQDRMTANVVGAIAPKLEQAEIERVKHKPTESHDAYDWYLRGMAAFHLWTRSANHEALAMFMKAIELDAGFAEAHAMAARCYAQRKSCGWTTDRAHEISETAKLARRAGELGKNNAIALCSAGAALWFVVGDLDGGRYFIDQALVLNPNMAWAWLSSGLLKVSLGDPEVAIEHAARAMRLSPQDTQVFVMQTIVAFAHLLAGRYSEAQDWSKRALHQHPDHIVATTVAAASGALAGDHAAARLAIGRLLQLQPDLRISNLVDVFPIHRAQDFALWENGLRIAGLPE